MRKGFFGEGFSTRFVALFLTAITLILPIVWAEGKAENGQIVTSPKPHSDGIKALPLGGSPELVVPPIDIESLIVRDKTQRTGCEKVLQFAEPFVVKADPKTFGQWERMDDDMAVWRLFVRATGATDVNIGFTDIFLPEGCRLFLRAPQYSYQIGPYTERDNRDYRQLWTPVLPGDYILIEAEMPLEAMEYFTLVIGQVNSGYLDVFENGLQDSDKQGTCNNDVICPIADGWRDEIRSVARYSISGTSLCTGGLVMNQRADFKPYFLTANHCLSTSGEAATVVVYWNYESPTCGLLSGGSLSQNQSGSTLRATYASSDFTLLELSTAPSPSFNVYYAGWDCSNTAAPAAVCIHHPSGDEKAISFENAALQSTNYLDTTVNASYNHWRVVDWDSGTTEPGSSGSGLWNATSRRIVGQLHGGYAACGNNSSDWYGKLYTSWTGGGTAASRLSTWLDPDSTGLTGMDGGNPDSGEGEGEGEGESVCTAISPYEPADPCHIQVINDDPYCCDVEWDGACQSAYDYCVGVEGEGEGEGEGEEGEGEGEGEEGEGEGECEPPVASATVYPDDGLAPLEVYFENYSTNGENCYWDFGDGATSVDWSPVHTYESPGEYEVYLEVYNGCGFDDYWLYVTVVDCFPPQANFEAFPSVGIALLTVSLLNFSIDVTSWYWNFGDGGLSYDWEPVHTYEVPGTYLVSLEVWNECAGNNYSYTEYTVRVYDEVELCNALDNCELYWATEGAANWFGQSLEAYDGEDAARSGGITHNQESFLETAMSQPGTITFWWSVSSESCCDPLTFYIDDIAQQEIRGDIGWQQCTYHVEANQRLKWRYSKDGSVNTGADCGWVDVVGFVADDDLFVLPSDGFTTSGPEGGPFTPATKAYTLTNSGGAPVNWTASCLESWASASPSNGALASGESVMVTLSVTETANSLAPGSYAAIATFTNMASGFEQTREIALNVGSLPCMSDSPNPADGAMEVPTDAILSWVCSNKDAGIPAAQMDIPARTIAEQKAILEQIVNNPSQQQGGLATVGSYPAQVFESNLGATVEILAFVGYADMSAGGEYENTLNAIAEHFTGFNVTPTTTEDPGELASALAGKQVFLLVEQENWSVSDMSTFGTNLSSLLHPFVMNGGSVIVCDHYPEGGVAGFLNNAGLMSPVWESSSYDYPAQVIAAHPITEGVASTFTAMDGCVVYSSVGDAETLIIHQTLSKPIVAAKRLGKGAVTLIGWDFYSYNTDMARVMANAVQWIPGDIYDVYLDEFNPPTTLHCADTWALTCDPGILENGRTYYWRVVSKNKYGETQGPVWSFNTVESGAVYHPADLNEDWRVVISEAIAYLAGWQQGSNPIAYAIRAAYLWQNGEGYLYDGGLDPPLCWQLAP